jgi:2-polyprenyl-3-methyl-5-hydroxy-6-metoxy-1,4-benzoquinol methylase
MSGSDAYLMENSEEALRLDVKTDPDAVRKQALLCGIGPGARVLDGGCGSGKTTSILHEMSQPNGFILGLDFSEDRIHFAKEHYGKTDGIGFLQRDLRGALADLGQFDFIWIRFVLEHYREGAIDIIKNITACLKPNGRLCLLDLDYNCLSHFPMKPEMESMLQKLIGEMMHNFNFDPFVGRKLYTYLYDLGFQDIEVNLFPHHLIYGELRSSDDFNWIKKIEMASMKAKDLFQEYPGGYDTFFHDFNTFFHDPRRFTYTPLMICTGKKPGQ